MKCTKCGNEVKEGYVFCTICGTRMMVEGIKSKHEISMTQNLLNSIPDNKKDKKSGGGCCGCFIIFLILILLVFGIVKGISWYKEYQFNKFIEETILVDDSFKAELTEQEKSEDWNNDGITNGDAEKLGLNVTVLDSDGDGISDYDEINVHNSDPLKYSTMDDIYSDGYKLKNGKDILTKYETFDILDTVNPFIKVEIDDAHDMSYVYKDYDGFIPDGYYLGFQPFRMFSFVGEVDIEFDNPNKYEVISFDLITYEVKKLKSKVDNQSLVFKITDDNPIMVVYKQSVIKSMGESTLSSIKDNFKNEVKKDYHVISFPFMTALFNFPIYVLEADNTILKGGTDEEFQSEFNEKAEGKFKISHHYTNYAGIRFIKMLLGGLTSEISKNVGEENESFVNYVVTYNRVSSDSELYDYLLGVYSSDESYEEESDEPIYDTTDPYSEKYSNLKCEMCADSGFKVDVNAFRFENLSTKVSSGGVCAGFSYITTNIYNGGRMPRTVVGEYDMRSIEYEPIWNKQLYSFEPTDEGLKTYSDLKKTHDKLDSLSMSSPDNEVVKALEYYWKDYNAATKVSTLNWHWNHSFEKHTFVDESTIKNVVNQLKSGKIVSVSLLKSNAGHAINAYKIVEDKDNPDILYLKAYDNNFPNDMFWSASSNGKVKYDVTIVLKKVYENTLFGEKVKYSYEYNPINSSSYNYGTYNKTFDGIYFYDENNRAL